MAKIDDDELVLALITCGENQTRAAEMVGVSRSSVVNRMKDSAFTSKLAAARAERMEKAAALADYALADSLCFLCEVLADRDNEPIYSKYSNDDRFRAISLLLGAVGKVTPKAD